MRRPLIALSLIASFSCSKKEKAAIQVPQPEIANSVEAPEAEPVVIDHSVTETFILQKNSTMFSELSKHGLDAQSILQLVSSSKSAYSLDRVPVGLEYSVTWNDESKEKISTLEFSISPTKRMTFDLDKSPWQPELRELNVDRIERKYSGIVSSNLWESATSAGIDASLIPELAEIFAWQIDFSREVRPGDRWRLVIEEEFVDGKSIGWGSILAAQYHTKDGDKYTGIRFPQEGPYGSYYQKDGRSLKLMFLKNPIRFGRITSRYSMRRFHPVQKVYKPHYGVDYAARTGTPIRTVGDGRIVTIGRRGGSGKMIKIRHNSVYTTAYLHLSRFAKGLKKGSKVVQGQTIGYVGQTGLATGPHLHFSFYKHGRYADPMGIKFPSADPVPEDQMVAFDKVATATLAQLPEWDRSTDIAEAADEDFSLQKEL